MNPKNWAPKLENVVKLPKNPTTIPILITWLIIWYCESRYNTTPIKKQPTILATRTPLIIKKLNGHNKTKKYLSIAPKAAKKPITKNWYRLFTIKL